jgi:hypothetical protein
VLANDWNLAGTFGMFSGSPFTVTANGSALNTPAEHADSRSGERGPKHDRRDRRQRPLLRPVALVQPTGVRFGTAERNAVYGPGGVNLDLSINQGVQVRRQQADGVPGRRRQHHQHAEVRQSQRGHHDR